MGKKGLFITVEGIDGCGKSVQAKLLEGYIKATGREVILLREPGGSQVGEQIRSVLLNKDNTNMVALTELLLFMSARAQVLEEIIKPTLAKGITIICDRFIDSTIAYQGYGRGIDLEIIMDLTELVIDKMYPDLTIIYDVPIDIGIARRSSTGKVDRLDNEKRSFYDRVHKGYKKLPMVFLEFDRIIKTIDARGDIDHVFQLTRDMFDKVLTELE